MEDLLHALGMTDTFWPLPTILIRLSKVDRAQLRDLLEQAWRRKAPRRLLAGTQL